jgi:hypothetical protein
MPGGFGTSQWPGGFDRSGYYHLPIRTSDGPGGLALALVRLTAAHVVVDTLEVPTDPKERDVFVLLFPNNGRAEMDVPFAGEFEWRLAISGAC